MASRRHTVSVRLDDGAARRLATAARLTQQSRGAFLGKVGDESARRVLVEWAVSQHQDGERSFSELAAETGLAVEEIMTTVSPDAPEHGLAQFLASARVAAEAAGNPEFLRSAERAANIVRNEYARSPAPREA